MIYMTPYEKPFYFIVLAIALLPMILVMLKGRRPLWYQNILTLLFLWISFGGSIHWKQGVALILYVLWQTILVWLYFLYRSKKNRGIVFYFAVLLAILPLAIVKIIPVIGHHPSFLGFLGISYLTFKAVQVIMEMRDGIIKEYSLGTYLQFLLFFPTISSGPIDRYRRFQADLDNPPTPDKYLDMVSKGIQMIFLGFIYKFLIGYILGSQLLPRVSDFALTQGGFSLGLVGYMYVYTFYLFFDFAGYSLFAVGTSYLMGYETPVNFNKPFLSVNIKDFWNRWHMSLSFWFRDYVYMRLMYLLIKKKVFKSKIVASNIGYFALFLLMGVWHGLTWFYIVYGIYHATLICLTDAWLRFKKKHRKQLPSNRFTKALAIFMTFHAVSISLLIFSGFLDTVFRFALRF